MRRGAVMKWALSFFVGIVAPCIACGATINDVSYDMDPAEFGNAVYSYAYAAFTQVGESDIGQFAYTLCGVVRDYIIKHNLDIKMSSGRPWVDVVDCESAISETATTTDIEDIFVNCGLAAKMIVNAAADQDVLLEKLAFITQDACSTYGLGGTVVCEIGEVTRCLNLEVANGLHQPFATCCIISPDLVDYARKNDQVRRGYHDGVQKRSYVLKPELVDMVSLDNFDNECNIVP